MSMRFFLMSAVLGALLIAACTVGEEPSFIAGAYCDIDGITTCDDEGFTILQCVSDGVDLIWQPIEDCPNGCTMDSGSPACIGGGETDTAVDKDTQLPDTTDTTDTADTAGGDTMVEVDEMDDMDMVDTTVDEDIVADDAAEVDDATVTDDAAEVDNATVADDAAEVDDAAVADDAAEVDDATVADDAAEVEDDTITDDAAVSDDDSPVDCGADWTLNDTTGTCYRYFTDTKSFDDAETACVTELGHLVSLASAAENDWVRDTLGIPADTAYWLGYSAADAVGPGTGSANGNSCSSASVVNSSGGAYSLATSGASTSSSGCTCSGTVNGKFVSFRLNNPTTGYWEIVADTTADAVITIHENPSCSSCTTNRKACVDSISTAGKEVFNNQYQLNSSKWYVIMIAGKSSNITGTLYIRPPVTAANFADQYVWTDGSSDAYNNFATGQPDYGNGNERCAQVWSDTVWGEWSDTQCSTTLPYVCEKEL